MTLSRFAFAALLSLGAASVSGAQTPAGTTPLLASFERKVDGFPIKDLAGTPYELPLLGGLERPRPQLVDIDGDGDLDLFIQDRPGRMSFFERDGARWVWRTDRWQDLEVGEWSRLVDVDGDGKIDLLAESPYSYIRYFRNEGTTQSPRLVLAADTLKDESGAPIFADRQNIPQLADFDCNRQLDLFLGRVDGTVARYEMLPLGADAIPRFRLLSERFEGIQIIGGEATEDGRPALPNAPGMPNAQPSLHGANTMAVIDIDSDGDLDILWGDFFEPGLLWIRNTGSCTSPSLRETPIPFPLGQPLATSGYNAPAGGDLDGDGDLDLLVGVIGGAFGPNRTSADNLIRLEQTAPGTWVARETRALSNLDIGSESSPALGDLDGDGDLDLIVGNKLEPGNPGQAALHFYVNDGTPTAPSFREAGTIPVGPGFHFAPALVDLDGDGDLDLVLGNWRDALQYYRNDGSRRVPNFVLADTALVRITRGSHTTPSFGDLDGDGDLDLVIGEASGTVNYYRNDGTKAAPKFTLVSEEWEGIKAGRRSVPRLVDLDGDGDLDLVVGNEAGQPLVYRNTGTKQAPKLTLESGSADWPAFSAPLFADLDGDGKIDLLMGTASGGLVYYRGR
ncbi:MAG TPA: FG-GAP-like repeat-containing protein [Gemmatimonadales bacterium]|nr:FG-GAP-like repeat-containing protein [Gemmatimonadales bacterium]